MKLETAVKTGLKIVACTYLSVVFAETALESYYITRDNINSSQSFMAVNYAVNQAKESPELMVAFAGEFLAHAANTVLKFGNRSL